MVSEFFHGLKTLNIAVGTTIGWLTLAMIYRIIIPVKFITLFILLQAIAPTLLGKEAKIQSLRDTVQITLNFRRLLLMHMAWDADLMI